MTRFDKVALRDELARSLSSQLEIAQRAHLASVEGATHEEAKPENDKDTRALEQSYLARGQAQRLTELREGIKLLQGIPPRNLDISPCCSVGAVVEVNVEGQTEVYWLAPAGGGTRLADGCVQVLTPQSPLGRALVGSTAGDQCEAFVRGRAIELEIVDVY